MKRVVTFVIFLFLALSVHIAEGTDIKYQELGEVQWGRSMDNALMLSKESDKPVFILFQEVPGCSTCVNYGKKVLSHPLVVEAIETLFVPLAVFNNHGGEDAKVLKSFNERSWNNPVIRIIDSHRREITRRLAGDYTIAGTTGLMIDALENDKIPVPEYLRIIQKENASFIKPETAILSMYCFWSGEIELGKIDGVVATRSGFMKSKEVVEVQYNPSVISYKSLLRKAKSIECANKVFVLDRRQHELALSVLGDERVEWASTFLPDREIKYYMSKSPYSLLPMTPLQSILINRAVYEGKNPDIYLSVRQLSMLTYIKLHPDRSWRNRSNDPDFTSSWKEILMEVGNITGETF
jgi:hypothetical protein